MKACTALFALTLGLASLAACSSGDTTTATGTSSTGDTSTSSASTATGGTGGAGGSTGSTTTGVGGTGGGATSSASSSTAGATSSGAGGMAAFALTSTGFSEGAEIPIKYTCDGVPKAGSPDLTWTAGPPGTLSYAVVFTDKFNSLTHWVIWDISGAITSLPAGVENKANPAVPAGSKQAKSFNPQTYGYLGPCPDKKHTYEFAVFALDVATLPNVTTATDRNLVKKEILLHDIGSATLTGTYTP